MGTENNVNGATGPSKDEPGLSSPTAGSSKSPVSANRNSRYYLDDSMAIFLVENQLFKVHRYFFRQESVIFESMFDCPAPGDGQDGRTDSKPIEIPEVTCAQFEALLDHFYDGLFKKDEYFNRDTPLQKYIDLLSISHRFECSTARERAIKGIDNATTNAIQMIELAEMYDVPKWLLPAYVELCRREEALNETEAIDLGPRKTVMIYRARETIRSSKETRQFLHNRHSSYGYSDDWPDNVFEKSRVERIINEILVPPSTPTPQWGQGTTPPIGRGKKAGKARPVR
ncbi:hypothetical protein VNI00_000229 [Paramarasmius palmivorus]|uniref:BTB domain-containing protein n=1 Tax=Paramarasmius palmivorus TaxID=297713 RepID=A0AAW0EC66_9AGAR